LRGEVQLLVNQSRSVISLGGLEGDPALGDEAQRWADTMARTRTLSHSPNLGRLLALGFDRAGENVGYSEETVAAVLQGFDESPSHRRNLLDPGWTSVGVGVSVSVHGETFVAVLFGTKSGAKPVKRAKAAVARVAAPAA
jgi:uncharacterized protein YkwD